MPAAMYRKGPSYQHAEITSVPITGILIQHKVQGWEAEEREEVFYQLGRLNGLVIPSTPLWHFHYFLS